jgi:UDP-N-acetylglucosamine 2-epimerase (non-hydrolysing)
MRILSVVGARPNFMKVAPIVRALARRPDRFEHVLVHTGQHYDEKMSGSFFADLEIPEPDFNLAVGSGSHAEQTAAVMVKIEPVLREVKPDVVIVVGDVNSTLAAALTAKKLNQTVAHVEAGLRSGDWAMPEEINRLATDAISDLLFTTDRGASEQLRREGVDERRIHFVGNVMIDSLMHKLPEAQSRAYHRDLGLQPGGYGVLTLHRPSNVDSSERLGEILEAILDAAPDLPIVFPIHPRTRARLAELDLASRVTARPGEPGLFLTEPLAYTEFLSLNRTARVVLTDSGGLQEETTALGVPCVTLRDNTERPITVEQGTNHMGGTRRAGIQAAIAAALAMRAGEARRPEFWDGHASDRIAEVLARLG